MNKYLKPENLLYTLLIILSPSIFYFLYFVCNGISDKPETWGQFGDFIGGTTNIIIGCMNILVTLLLAKTISELDNNRFEESKNLDDIRHQQTINAQKQQFENELILADYEKYNELFIEFVQIIYSDLNYFIVSEKFLSIKIKILSHLKSKTKFHSFLNFNDYLLYYSNSELFMKDLRDISLNQNAKPTDISNLPTYKESVRLLELVVDDYEKHIKDNILKN